MKSRRQFIRDSALFSAAVAGLSGAGGSFNAVMGAIRRASAIAADPGSSVWDAEHVVVLMQENRSFDHCFGTFRGVRGFNDPRAIRLADGRPVWVQRNASGERYVPFRLDIQGTKSTWMGCLPHGRGDQLDAWNQGQYDRWLTVKASGEKAYAKMPLTLGYYDRRDVPFYHALADAFTICDQHFCSSLTGTTPNRLHLWTGMTRAAKSADAPAFLRNEDVDYGTWRSWATFPERLEDAGVSWRIYQNGLDIATGLSDEAKPWLSNFGDSPLEWFTQYNVRLVAERRAYVAAQLQSLPLQLSSFKAQAEALSQQGFAAGSAQRRKLKKLMDETASQMQELQAEQAAFTDEKLASLSPRERALHERAFTLNPGDPDYRSLVEIAYRDGDAEHRVKVPKGDLLHQFRADVEGGKLPAVSWIVAPERFSDHPSSPWYGAWYISQVLDILTKTPQVWKKTVFILTYDENDGYFDHVPPFVAPNPAKPETGKVSAGIDASVEFITREQEASWKLGHEPREGPIGLGYRVPLVIASPWTRGGNVCSQVFDHTSVIRFMEQLLSRRTGKKIEEPNISSWRRAVCGDLTSAFGPASDTGAAPPALDRDRVVADIHRAQFRGLPGGFRALSDADVARISREGGTMELMPQQEQGTRRACPLPYELEADGNTGGLGSLRLSMAASSTAFGARAAGAPFTAYAVLAPGKMEVRNYAVAPGESVVDEWPLTAFERGLYHLRLHGPNGFYREMRGGGQEPQMEVRLSNEVFNGKLTGNVLLRATSNHPRPLTFEVIDNAFGQPAQRREMVAPNDTTLTVPTRASGGWYDLTVRVYEGGTRLEPFERRCAGHAETGAWSTTDPVMGRSRS